MTFLYFKELRLKFYFTRVLRFALYKNVIYTDKIKDDHLGKDGTEETEDKF